jgi:drug/metabolite transporter (DMT)-like permease
MIAAAIVFAVLSALSNACSAVLQRLAVVHHKSATAGPAWRAAIDLVRQPAWLLGGLFLVGTFVFQALGLYFGPLSLVQPVLVLELIFTLGLRVFLLHDDIAARTWSAALTICLGLAAFLVVASPGDGTHVPDASQWMVAVGTRGLAVLGLLLLARSGSPARRAALYGAATAVVWSVDAAFVKQTVDVLAHGGPPALFMHWPLYAMIATGVLGTALLQGAYAAGPLAASQAALLIVDPLVSITLGVELFHEQLSSDPGHVIGAIVALAALGGGGRDAVGLGSSGDDGRGTRRPSRPPAARRVRSAVTPAPDVSAQRWPDESSQAEILLIGVQRPMLARQERPRASIAGVSRTLARSRPSIIGRP